MDANARDSIESYSRLTSMNEFETHTREVVMDFMGLVPITCPPSLISFKPFTTSQDGSSCLDEVFEGDEIDGRKTLRISSTSDKHKTIIRKCNKLVILEEEEGEGKMAKSNRSTKSKPSRKLKLSKFFYNLVSYMKPGSMSSSQSSKDMRHLVSPSSDDGKFNKSWKAVLRERSRDSNSTKKSSTKSMTGVEVDSTDGPNKPVELSINQVPFNWNFSTPVVQKVEVPKPSKPVQKFNSIIRRRSKKADLNLKLKKDSVYVDVGDVDDIDGMVNQKHLSPAALPLQRELQGLRTRPGSPSLTPQTEVANALRVIADQVEEEYSEAISKAVGRLVNYEEVSRLGYEELKVVALEILKDVTPGWSQVAVPLVMSQMVAMSLLVLGNRSVVSRLVDWTTRFICGSLNTTVLEQGGWSGIRGMKVNEVSIERGSPDQPG